MKQLSHLLITPGHLKTATRHQYEPHALQSQSSSLKTLINHKQGGRATNQHSTPGTKEGRKGEGERCAAQTLLDPPPALQYIAFIATGSIYTQRGISDVKTPPNYFLIYLPYKMADC